MGTSRCHKNCESISSCSLRQYSSSPFRSQRWIQKTFFKLEPQCRWQSQTAIKAGCIILSYDGSTDHELLQAYKRFWLQHRSSQAFNSTQVELYSWTENWCSIILQDRRAKKVDHLHTPIVQDCDKHLNANKTKQRSTHAGNPQTRGGAVRREERWMKIAIDGPPRNLQNALATLRCGGPSCGRDCVLVHGAWTRGKALEEIQARQCVFGEVVVRRYVSERHCWSPRHVLPLRASNLRLY